MVAMSGKQVFGQYYFDSAVVSGVSYKQLMASYFLSVLPILPLDTIPEQNEAPSQYILDVF